MNIKSKKIVLIDEVSVFLARLSKGNKSQENFNRYQYERNINKILNENYVIMNLNKTEEYIEFINQLNLFKDEKLKLLNFKPRNIVELSVVR